MGLPCRLRRGGWGRWVGLVCGAGFAQNFAVQSQEAGAEAKTRLFCRATQQIADGGLR